MPASDTGTASPAAAAPDILDGDADDRSHRSPATPVLQRARAALFIGGSVAAALIGMNALLNSEPERTPLADDATCAITQRAEALPGPGGHPERAFYASTETAPINDFGHSLGDGYLVVLYSPAFDQGDVASLEQFVGSPAGQGVLAGAVTPPVAQQLPAGDLGSETIVKVLNLNDVMTCDDFELDSLETFADAWFTRDS